MNLEGGEEMAWLDAHRRRHPPAVFHDVNGIVLRADAAVQAGINAIGDAAIAAEESVTQAGDGRKQRRCQRHEGWSSAARCSSSLSPTSVSMPGWEMPLTLNIDPMPLRPPPVRRCSASATSCETSWVALAISVTPRVSIPTRLRKPPSDTGPSP